MAPTGSGILFVVSAPSGTGKSTLAAHVLQDVPGVEFSVSYTTRAARPGETQGEHYHFIDRARFEEMVSGGQFVEWAEVFGKLYGTALAETRSILAAGRDVLLDIDVQGARQVRESPLEAVSIMILPPDFQTLESRLQARGSESDEVRAGRLAQARSELEDFERFDYVVVNDDLQRTAGELASIVRAERRRTSHCGEHAREIIATFPA